MMASILLIEGHRMMRGALWDLLEQSGMHQLESVSDAISAVQSVLRHVPQVIVLDSIGSEINGLYLSRILREIVPLTKIVLLVDEEWSDDTELRHSSGADEFIAKAALSRRLPEVLDAVMP